MKNNKIILTKALEYCNKALSFSAGMDISTFLQNEEKKAAISLMIIQVGEMCNQLSPAFRNDFPDVRWKYIKDIRNRITHGYGDINFRAVWKVLEKDIPQFKTFFENRLVNYELENPPPRQNPPDMSL